MCVSEFLCTIYRSPELVQLRLLARICRQHRIVQQTARTQMVCNYCRTHIQRQLRSLITRRQGRTNYFMKFGQIVSSDVRQFRVIDDALRRISLLISAPCKVRFKIHQKPGPPSPCSSCDSIFRCRSTSMLFSRKTHNQIAGLRDHIHRRLTYPARDAKFQQGGRRLAVRTD